MPGAIEGTFVTMPANGAFTTVWSSWRAASFRLGHGIAIARVLLDRNIGVTVEVGGDGGKLLVERGQLLLRVLLVPARRVESLLRRDVLGREVLLTAEFAIIILDVVLGLLDLREHVLVVRLERVQIVPDDPDLRIGALKSELEREIVQAEENLARFDLLIVPDVDFLDDAGDVGRDTDFVSFDIRVVRRHHSAAGDIPVTANDQGEREQREQRPPQPAPARRWRSLFGLRGPLDRPVRLRMWKSLWLLLWRPRRLLSWGVAPCGRHLGRIGAKRNYGRISGHITFFDA